MRSIEVIDMESLVDREIKALAISPDGAYLAWHTDMGVLLYEAYGDCCSNSWFESVTGVNNFGKVVAVEGLTMPEPDQGDHECLQAYGIKITTDKGHIIIEYRNASNGYYGGSCNLIKELPDRVTIMREIREDWIINT